MKKMRKMKERILSLVLTFVMVVSLFTGMAPVEVRAAGSPSADELSKPITTLDVSLQVTDDGVECLGLGSAEGNYKWVYFYYPAVQEGGYEYMVNSFQSMIDNGTTMGDFKVNHTPEYDMIINDIPSNGAIERYKDYNILIIASIYDYPMSSDGSTDYYCDKIAVFDISSNGNVSNGLSGGGENPTPDETDGKIKDLASIVDYDETTNTFTVTLDESKRYVITNIQYATGLYAGMSASQFIESYGDVEDRVNNDTKNSNILESLDDITDTNVLQGYALSNVIVKVYNQIDSNKLVTGQSQATVSLPKGGLFAVYEIKDGNGRQDSSDGLMGTYYITTGIYAKFIPPVETPAETATLTYEVVGGSGSMAAETLTSGGEFTLPNPSFTPDTNRVFFGWIVEDENGNQVTMGYSDSKFEVEAGKTYTATAYYGYAVTILNLPENADASTVSKYIGNTNSVVVPEFPVGTYKEEGNILEIFSESMNGAPTLIADNAKVVHLNSYGDSYTYIIRNITGPVTITLSDPPEVSGNIEKKEDVSIKKVEANKYEVQGLEEEAGFKWVYCLTTVGEDEDVNAIIESELAEWLSSEKGKYVEVSKVWGVDAEPYTISGSFYGSSIDDYDYVQIFKLDYKGNVHEIALLPLPEEIQVEPEYPLGNVESLEEDSIKFEDNTVNFNVQNDEDYFYVKVVMSEGNLTGMSLEDYRDSLNAGKTKSVIDAKTLGDTLEDIIESGFATSGQIYALSSQEPWFSDEVPITEKSLAFVVKLHKDNVKVVEGQYIYAVYGVHAEIVSPTDSGEPGESEIEAPAITGQPQNATVEEGQKATFTVTATGDDLSYQWKIDRNDGKGFVNLDSTTATHTTTVVDMSCNGFKYKCIVSNSVGAVTSNVVTLTVTEKEVVHTHDLTLVPVKAATCTEEGNKAYYTCSGCDSLFTDAEGTKTTTAEAVKIAALGHDMTAATCKEPGVCKRSGCDHTVDALGHDWSGEWTIIKEATATEEGKKETYCTRKCGQKKVAVIPIEGEEDEDAGNIEKDAEVDPEAPVDEATIDNKKEDLLEGDIFTDEEKKLIEAGEEARVWLEIGKTDEDAIAADDKAKIEKEAADIMGDDAKITYFDADLFKQVGNGKKTEITEPGVDIKITITIPEELLNQDKTITREYKIIRLHEDEVDVISGTFDPATGEFSFETDRFSTYAIVYDDVPVDDDDDTTDDDVDDGDEKDDVPDTGVVSTSSYVAALTLISGLGLVFCSSKKNDNE